MTPAAVFYSAYICYSLKTDGNSHSHSCLRRWDQKAGWSPPLIRQKKKKNAGSRVCGFKQTTDWNNWDLNLGLIAGFRKQCVPPPHFFFLFFFKGRPRLVSNGFQRSIKLTKFNSARQGRELSSDIKLAHELTASNSTRLKHIYYIALFSNEFYTSKTYIHSPN